MVYRLRREKQQNVEYYVISEKLLAQRVSKPSISFLNFLTSHLPPSFFNPPCKSIWLFIIFLFVIDFFSGFI